VEAQFTLLRAKKDQLLRKRAKLALAKKLFNCRLDKKKISNLYKFIDWLIKLDNNHMKAYQTELQQVSEKESWQDWDPVYVPTAYKVAEMNGLEKGLQKGQKTGLKEGELKSARNILEELLTVRFNKKERLRYESTIEKANLKTLHRWIKNVVNAPSADAVFQ
jgi:hypothetical protein